MRGDGRPEQHHGGSREATVSPFIARSLTTLVIPQGYTLSIAGAFASGVRRYGFPDYIDIEAFVAGAVAAFILLAIVVHWRSGLSSGQQATGLLPLMNLAPLVVVPLALGAVLVLPSPHAGFLAAGTLAAGGYALIVSAFLWLVSRGA